MGSRSRVNRILLLLVAALGLAVWLAPPQAPLAPEPLTRRQPGEIQQITLRNRNGTDLALERRADGWWMIRPYRVRANPARIELLLGILTTPSHESFPVPDDLGPFGLQEPAARLTVDGLQIEMGGTHPYNHDRYLRIGDRIHLIKDLFPHHLLAAAEAYVSPELLPAGAEIQFIETPDWKLWRDPDGSWRLTPSPRDLSQDPLVARAQAWRQARALQVMAAPPAAPAGGLVSIGLAGGDPPIRFELLKRDGDTLLIRRTLGLAYRLPPASPLLSTPGD